MSSAMTPSLASMQLDDFPSSECVCPSEILFDILDMLPSRTLVGLRDVSRHFKDTVDSLLRGRFLNITNDPLHEFVFESSSPANYRSTHRQQIVFSRFLDKAYLATDVAAFRLPASPPVPHFVPLDEDELFGSHLLSVHIRGAEEPEPPTPSASDESTPDPTDLRVATVSSSSPFPYSSTTRPIGISAVGMRSNVYPSSPSPSASTSSSISPASSTPSTAFTSPSSSPAQRRRPVFSFSLSLAEGLERLYRNWFESPLCISLSHPRETAEHVLSPSGGTALLCATVACYQVPMTVPAAGSVGSVAYPFSSYGSGSLSPGLNRAFEFYYKEVQMSVAKMLVGVEEGLSKGGCRGEVVLWMSL